MQSANVHEAMYYHNKHWYTVHLQVLQNWPDHPGEQLHLLGAEHVPPLAQSGLQIALIYGQYSVCYNCC